MKNTRLIALVVASVISGYLSATVHIDEVGNGFLNQVVGPVLPGLLFGMVIACYVILTQQMFVSQFFRTIVLVVISGLAYYVAVYTTLAAAFLNSASFFSGGIIGALLLLIGFHFLFHKLNQRQFLGLIVLGGVLGWIGGYTSLHFAEQTDRLLPDFVILFVLWQAGMAYAIAKVLEGFGRR